MSTAAELNRKVAHINDTHDVSVLFSKERLGPGPLRFFNGHILYDNFQPF